jgi:hypothetical protein
MSRKVSKEVSEKKKKHLNELKVEFKNQMSKLKLRDCLISKLIFFLKYIYLFIYFRISQKVYFSKFKYLFLHFA